MLHALTKPSASALLDDLRKACADVAVQASHVRIATEKIPAYVTALLDQYPLTTALDDNHFLSASAEETASYILALDSLNFGSGYFRQARDEGIAFSYTIFARGLKNAFAQGDMNTPKKWARARAEDFHRIFNIPKNANLSIDRLFSLFARHLGNTGTMILERYNGQTLALVNEAQGSAARLVERLAAWPDFADISTYKGRPVPLLKRA